MSPPDVPRPIPPMPPQRPPRPNNGDSAHTLNPTPPTPTPTPTNPHPNTPQRQQQPQPQQLPPQQHHTTRPAQPTVVSTGRRRRDGSRRIRGSGIGGRSQLRHARRPAAGCGSTRAALSRPRRLHTLTRANRPPAILRHPSSTRTRRLSSSHKRPATLNRRSRRRRPSHPLRVTRRRHSRPIRRPPQPSSANSAQVTHAPCVSDR